MSPLANFRSTLRRRARRHRLGLAVTAVFAGLSLNVAVQDGPKALLVLLLVAVGYFVVVAVPTYITGASAAKHSLRERQAIEAGKHPAKELTR